MNQIRSITPVSDAQAARMATDGALADLARQIVATPVPAERSHPAASSRRRRWLIGAPVAGVAAAAVITAGVVALSGLPEGRSTGSAPGASRSAVAPSPGPVASAAELAAYATRAAAAGPAFDPRPHQWIYTDLLRATSSAGTGGYLAGPPNGRLSQQTWARVDGQMYAYLKNGRLVIVRANVPRSARTGRAVQPVPFGWPSAGYAYLDSLPSSPARLLAVIKDNLASEPDPVGTQGTGNVGVFNAVQALVQNAILPPRLLAALYGVLARDPAVHFERSVTDLAGRTGVGFSTVQDGYLKEQIVINPRTYAYMGYVDIAVKAHTSVALDGTARIRKGQVLGWQALLGSGIVQRPGQVP
jgi:hypothetical protein